MTFGGLTAAAVLVPLYRDAAGALRVVFVLRSEHGIHGGQIALPGGRPQPSDADLLATALRESEEEIGLQRNDVRVLTELPTVDTSTGFLITPFLAHVVVAPATWRRQEREIKDVLPVALTDLAQPEARGEETWHLPRWPSPRRISFVRIGPHKLWGATFRIVDPLIPRLLAGEWGL